MQTINSKTEKKKPSLKTIMRIITVFVMIFFILLPYLYVSLEKDHECQKEECCICENIERCYGIITTAGKTVVFVITGIMLIFQIEYKSVNKINRSLDRYIRIPRVRMNN